MERRVISIISASVFALAGALASPAWAEMEVGEFIVSGEGEVSGLPGNQDGKDAKFEEYRDVPETLIVPQLQLRIGRKKQDFYLEFDSTKVGLNDQNYQVRFGRYGLFDVEFEWDQIPHIFSIDTARTPYTRGGDGENQTLATKPASTAGADVEAWVNGDSEAIDLKMLQGIGRIRVRYTPTPGWKFIGGYSSQKTSGDRAFGMLFGSSAGSYNITELAEPIEYQTHNLELGGEYAGDGWSLGLKYHGSLFHNSSSTLTWDNPLNPGIGGACVDDAVYDGAAGTGPCRGRLDLYPSNQAHTLSLSGATALPLMTRFMGTVSYGWRLQDDSFLPGTINSALAIPAISRSSLDGDVRPLMVNATFVNRYFRHLNIKTFYRLYDFDNRSKRVSLPEGYIRNDSTLRDIELVSFPYSYTKHNIGVEGGYDVTRWLSAKLSYLWEKMQRERREVLNANEHTFGPTFDIKPNSWVLVRASYRRSLRDADDYDAGRYTAIFVGETPADFRAEILDALRKPDEAARERDKVSLFTQVSPWTNLTLHGGFEFSRDIFPHSQVGLQNDFNYSPSIGFVYAPCEWATLFGDYNWERFDWKMIAMERTSTAQTPETNPERLWTSRGRDKIHTVSLGTDLDLLRELLKLRLQYGFSYGRSKVNASGGVTPATNYPAITNTWHEFLTRFEYLLHKNVALRFGYYFNRYTSEDFGVDIMKPWMGDVDTGANVTRSIFLGDMIKGDYTAHVGFVGLRFTF